MLAPAFDIETRIKTLNAALAKKDDQHVVKHELEAAKGDLTVALKKLQHKLPVATLQKLALAHSLAEWSDDNLPVVQALAAQPNIKSLRDVALNFNTTKLAALVQPAHLPTATAGKTPGEKATNFATALHNRLFANETSAVLQRMVQDAEVPIKDAALRTGVAAFLNNQPDFNIRTTSIDTALKHPEAFKDIADDQRSGVVEHLKTLQRVQAISPTPETVPALMKANVTSAFRAAELTESAFLRAFSGSLGEEVARQTHTNAINAHIRNEHALTTMRQTLRGTGLAIIDGKQSREERVSALQGVADQNGVPLNLSTLFGSLDYCECDDCLSVYSPAAYFVELLQFLRNNDLQLDNAGSGDTGIIGTPLEILFRRRPDLGCLELTCENTFTVLPYVDLVNEVMESFLVHLGDYDTSSPDPGLRRATLEAFNVEDETSGELLAIPQHVNYEAYCTLKSAVYPFTLPYHQPIDATRIFLHYMGTSRWELIDTFRTPTESCPDAKLSADQLKELAALHQQVIDRAVDADFLGMTQEEYIILTHEAFWPKRYFDLTQDTVFAVADYQQKIGVRDVWEYFGYTPGDSGKTDMLSLDDDPVTGMKGLTFIKRQFLPRTGIKYADLVELLKTRFINPNFPQGQALLILESLRFSYRFLQTLVDAGTDPEVRFARLVAFLENPGLFIPQLAPLLNPAADPCRPSPPKHCEEPVDLLAWLTCYFDRVGRLIVIDSEEGTRLPMAGQLINTATQAVVGVLNSDGSIWDLSNTLIGQVGVTLVTFRQEVAGQHGPEVVDESGDEIGVVDADVAKTLADGAVVAMAGPIAWLKGGFPGVELTIQSGTEELLRILDDGRIQDGSENVVLWLPSRDTCDLSKSRLVHLDGSSVESGEYDRIQRFLRLWRKLGWTVDETDKALMGLAPGGGLGGVVGGGSGSGAGGDACEFVGFDTFIDDCSTSGGDTSGCGSGGGQPGVPDGCPDLVVIDADIQPNLLHQLRAAKVLLDQTGLSLPKLLALWSDISTHGENSLYAKLFLTHNLVSIDSVFQPDAHGNYLTRPAKITDHLPVLMAVFKRRADDIAAIVALVGLPDSLTLPAASAIYRHSLLAKILNIRVSLLADAIALFGSPFRSAWDTQQFLETWGKMEDAGFTFRQLDYLVQDRDDPVRPLAPSKRAVLQLAKTLYDGLNAIDRDHGDLGPNDEATSDFVRANAGLLFEQGVVEQVLGLLEGTTVYTTNAPVGLTIVVPTSLGKKLQYLQAKDAGAPLASLQLTGILTDAERLIALSLSAHPEWDSAIARAGKQAQNVLNDVLFAMFPNFAEARKQLLSGDFANPTDPQDPANTAPVKRLYFAKFFLPFLREQLAQRLIGDTTSAAAGLPADIARELLTDILWVGAAKVPAMQALEAIKTAPAGSATGWKGYLIPSADADFTFVAIGDTQPPALLLDGQSLPFAVQQEDPSNVWSTDPAKAVKLRSGKLYWLEIADRPAEQLQWKTPITTKAHIPTSALLPDFTTQGTQEAYIKLFKAGLVVSGFNLSLDEVEFLQTHSSDFDGLDFNAVTLKHWLRIQAYTDLRNGLPRTDSSLLDLFKWAGAPDDPAKLADRIAAATTWKTDLISQLIAPDPSDPKEHFDLNRPAEFRNEIHLVQLRRAIAVADKVGVDADRLFDWANPGSKFWACHQIAEDIRKALRARFDEDDWEQVVKPLNDQLREHQKQALIDYLLVQPDLIAWGVVDADSLFEFFLIDVQMDACMETSRMVQAIASAQLFIQRCLLGLEERRDSGGSEIGVTSSTLDRGRWEWMQQYRVWEANRKVFLYPENWIVPELRDDKSAFFKELESELLQKDINTQTTRDALLNYVFKVDEVANLKVIGLFAELVFDNNGNPVVGSDGNFVFSKLHVFGRTRNAPYLVFYRTFVVAERSWYAWERVQVDIPGYEVEDSNGKVIENGAYLVPIVWNGRLLIFLPQFNRKTQPGSKIDSSKKFDDLKTVPIGDAQSVVFWEIKLAWSEYRNGKWTQKQISSDAIVSSAGGPALFPIQNHEFTPIALSDSITINVSFVDEGSPDPPAALGAFAFSGSKLRTTQPSGINEPKTNDFQYVGQSVPAGSNDVVSRIFSLQTVENSDPPLFEVEPYFEDVVSDANGDTVAVQALGQKNNFCHSFSHDLLGAVSQGGTGALFAYYAKQVGDKLDAFGGSIGSGGQATYSELNATYSIYNWEAAFHAPMLLVERLVKAQRFEQALKVCAYVLDPFASPPPDDQTRFWQFVPFREVQSEDVLQNLFLSLAPRQPNAEIDAWRNNPFQPHRVARGRPAAYMMWVATTYIKILIAWGDQLFTQDTRETINQATQLYVLAAHVYGPRGQKIPKRGRVLPETYNSLLDKWDAFGNAMVELELAFPFSNQISGAIGTSNGVVGLANIFGFATSLYFCIPDNPDLTALRDTIDDRLFKIRHCENIEGVFQQLPLFEPPIDPALLVQAAAQGLSLSTVLSDLNSPMPNYRFYYLLQKALELCGELKSLGNAFLSAKEKGDGEAIQRLRATHDSSIQALVMEVRTQQADEATQALEALRQSRKGPENRMQYHLQLIDVDLSAVPGSDVDFPGIANSTIEKPVDESGMKLIAYEKEEMDKAAEANDKQEDVGRSEAVVSLLHLVPEFALDFMPLGCGTHATFGGNALGNAAQAVARANQVVVSNRTYSSTNAGRKANFLRQLQERVNQANMAGFEIKNIDKQVLTQQIRIGIANQEITNQQKQIDNAQEVFEFLQGKYTNQELYGWMESQVRTLYYQTYTVAYDLAKKAEKAFRFERGLTSTNFIQYGYWDPGYDGLLSGERLYVGLKQLEAAYQEKRGHDFEVVKNISLQQLSPLQLVQLREAGRCEFDLPEVLFDMGFPGQYMRRIKSVALTFACLVGPYTSLNCTLRLLEHKFRVNAIVSGNGDYAERVDGSEDRFSTTNVPITSISVSSGQNDSGVFELNFRDERYIPFEGAGAISKWRMELPESFREFDYGSITDVVMHVRYTSLDGGDKLAKAASAAVADYVKGAVDLSREQGLFAFFDVPHDFGNAWYTANNPPVGTTDRVVVLDSIADRLPVFTRGTPMGKIEATDVYVLVQSTSKLTADKIELSGADGTQFEFTQSVDSGGSLQSFKTQPECPMTTWKLKVADVSTDVAQLWVVVKYVLQP